jgi:UDP-3-O-[3-hydroxymyristoyl] glucosamine N-acyltransferase
LILSKAAFQNLKKATANFLIVDHPRAVFFQIVEKYFKTNRLSGRESSAFVDESSVIGKNCYIGHNVVIEKNCKIGNNTTILHNTSVLAGTIIGEHVTIGCNNTIGNYGFGYEKDSDGNYFLLQHMGNVVIHDHVEIHNNTCIDRGVLGTTEIHENTKIDNLVHIAHGVVIGRNSLVIANAMVAGSAVIGENSWIAPSVSIKNKAIIAPHTMTGIGAVVLKDTESNFTYIGNPATTMEDYKNWSALKKKLMNDNPTK